MIKDTSVDFHWFPLDNPGLVSIPLAFLLGWLGTMTSKEHYEEKYAEMEVRSLTGAGRTRRSAPVRQLTGPGTRSAGHPHARIPPGAVRDR